MKIIAIGFLLALWGAISIASGVMGLSNLYVGKYVEGLILILFAGLSGYFFKEKGQSFFHRIHEPGSLDIPLEEINVESAVYKSVGRVIVFCLFALSLILIIGGPVTSSGIGRWLNPLAGLFLSALGVVLLEIVKKHES